MPTQAGYYSLVQFCPDVARLEAVNVGVLVFCPQSGFLEIKLTEDDDRVAKMFGKHSFHPPSLDAAKRGLVYRLTRTEDRPKTREDLEHFIAARGDAVRLSVLRPLVTEDPVRQLDDLFRQLVLEPVFSPPTGPDNGLANAEDVLTESGGVRDA